MTRPRTKRLLAAAAVVALAIPALAQDRPTSILPPGFGDAPPPPPQSSPAPPPNSGSSSPDPLGPEPVTPSPSVSSPASIGGDEDQVSESDTLDNADVAAAAEVPEPQEVPDSARRDPSHVGRLDPVAVGLGPDPWGAARGSFLEQIMRRTRASSASRWMHIALRNALLAKTDTPFGLNPADWVAERSWLLLRMGEADASRMLVSDVDVTDFTPKLTQVAAQSALANADPAGLCPLRDGLGAVEPRIAPLVRAMCSSLSGNAEAAAANIDDARRRGRMGGIDVSLADKLVGAGADTARAVTIEWDPVDQLNSWRFGLAAASGINIPDRLLASASPQLRAWQARAPMLAVEQRLSAARIATGLGVFSGQSLVDLYSAIYDRTDPDQLSASDAWQLRLAFAGRDQATRLGAMRRLWSKADKGLDREATRAMLAIAASRIAPDAGLGDDAANIIASLLAAGMDQEAAKWAPVVDQLDQGAQDRCWAMLALAAPASQGLDLSYGRIDKFIGRDKSVGHRRGALLVAGLAGLGRIDGKTAGGLSARYGFGLERRNEWTNLIDGAAARRQGGTATVLAGMGFEAPEWNGVPALFLYHAVNALAQTGQAFNARMIAAEALSRS